MNDFVAEWRYPTLVAHSHYFVHREWRHRFISHIIHYYLAHSSMDISHQPGEPGGGPWYGQLRNLTLLNDFHHSVDCGSTQDDLKIFQSRVLHHYGYLIFVVPLNTGYLDIHHDEPLRLHHDTSDPGYGGYLPSYLLSEVIQGHDIHAPLSGIGGSNKVNLRSIVQETGCQLTINQDLTQILRANEMTIGIRI